MIKNDLTKEYINEWFYYTEDGNLHWKKKPCRNVRVGAIVGTNKEGYQKLNHLKKYYCVHRLIYTLHHDIPKFYIDHIDGNTRNNRIENLRDVTLSVNQHNQHRNRHIHGNYSKELGGEEVSD